MCSQSVKKTFLWWQKPLVGIVWVLMLGICNLSVAQTENEGNEIDISFSEVSETQIVGESSQLGIKLSATRENDNDVVSIQLSDNKTVVLSRNVGNLNFYVSSKQFDTATSFVAEGKENTTIDVLAEYLWQYRGYNALGDTLLDALLVLSNWPQGVAFEEPELSTDNPDRVTTYLLTVTISPNITAGKVTSVTSLGSINCGNGGNICKGNYGGTVTLTATPVAGYYGFKGWSGACTNTTTTCTINMTSPKTVTAIFTELPRYTLSIAVSPSISGRVTSSPSMIDCGGNGNNICKATNVAGKVTLTATPTSGYLFKEWSGACTGTATTCTVSMTAAKSVTATFVMITYPLTITTNLANFGKVSSSPAGIDCGTVCSYDFEAGSNVTLTATANGTFTGWSGSCTGTAPTCTVNMSAAKSVTANFSSGYLLSLSTTVNNVAVSPSAMAFTMGGPVIQSSPAGINCGGNSDVCSYIFDRDSKVTLTLAIPDSHFIFSAWGDACAGKTPNDCSVNMTAAQTVTATFVTNKLEIYVKPNGSTGTVTVSSSSGFLCSSPLYLSFMQSSYQSCTASQSFGKTVVLTAVPAAGYKFTGWNGAGWYGNCTGTASSCTLTMNGPEIVLANFAPQ